MKRSVLINQSDPNLTQHLDVQISLANGRHKFKRLGLWVFFFFK